MILFATEENNTGGFHSHVSLVNPYKEGIIKRVCQSEPFIKPKLSLKKMVRACFKFKVPAHLREDKASVQHDMYKPRKNHQIPGNTDNRIRTVSKKNKSEQVRIEQTSAKAGGLQIPKKDWQNIRRSSDKVILDTNTANPALRLSQDGRSVRTKTYEEYQSSQSYHEYHRKCKHQYNGWACVQAKEGYSTGRHYWEVDVKGKCEWRVGVVKESAPRRGFVKLNTETGYWTLRLQLGSLMALTEPVTKLNQVPLSKIGVYLDFEKGRVSFYDAVKRKHIYTFKTEFSKDENIYPVFGTVETDKPLKII